MPKVIVGMSGGVDSSVTAHLLRKEGYEVEGVSFILWEARSRSSVTACCSLEATGAAALTASQIGIRHSSVDVRGEFIEKVIEPFAEAYTKGLTPNPCILCNRHIKFPFLLSEADKRGAEYIATGHYAQVERGGRGQLLKKGIDPRKDQSYVLYALRRQELERLLLPLGRYRKEEVRELARSHGLPAADRPESQEICFIEDRNYPKFIEALLPSASEPGPILDVKGNLLGTHHGLHRYTVGQRKSLGLSARSPYYVAGIDPSKNAVIVGSREDVMIRELVAGDLNWLIRPEEVPSRAAVKVRSMMEDRPAALSFADDAVTVLFDEPEWPPSPGQSAVFYAGDVVIGGGVIKTIKGRESDRAEGSASL